MRVGNDGGMTAGRQDDCSSAATAYKVSMIWDVWRAAFLAIGSTTAVIEQVYSGTDGAG